MGFCCVEKNWKTRGYINKGKRRPQKVRYFTSFDKTEESGTAAKISKSNKIHFLFNPYFHQLDTISYKTFHSIELVISLENVGTKGNGIFSGFGEKMSCVAVLYLVFEKSV